jgi:integrase
LSPYLHKVYGSPEELPLRDLLVALLGPEGRGKSEFKSLQNDELFEPYFGDLALRITNGKNLKCIRALLYGFKDFLGDYPPSVELAKGFLAKYTGLAPHTWYNYVGELRSFMT